MEKSFVFYVDLGIKTSIKFFVTEMHSTEKGVRYFGRIDEHGSLMPNLGVMRLDIDKKIIGISYDCFISTFDITEKKEVDGNFMIYCANDLFKFVKLYLVDENRWLNDGRSIFD